MTYKAAVIGCGRIGCGFDDDPKRKHVATHAGAYSKVDETKLVALVDTDTEKLKKYGEKYGAKGYTDYREMLEKEKPDIVSVCTWNNTHQDIIKDLVKRNVKAIFCEKPISHTIDSAKEIVELCEKNNVVLIIDHQRRFDFFHNDVKKYIEEGRLGRIQEAAFYYTAGIANTGSHMFDLLRFFLGDASWVYAVESPNRSPNEKDPNLDGLVGFKSGTIASIHALDVKSYMLFELDMLGTKGRLRITHSGFSCDYYEPAESKLYSGYIEAYPKEPPVDPNQPKDFMVNGVKHIVACLDGKEKPKSSGLDGLRSLELICAFRESAEKGGAKIELPLKESGIEIMSR